MLPQTFTILFYCQNSHTKCAHLATLFAKNWKKGAQETRDSDAKFGKRKAREIQNDNTERKERKFKNYMDGTTYMKNSVYSTLSPKDI